MKLQKLVPTVRNATYEPSKRNLDVHFRAKRRVGDDMMAVEMGEGDIGNVLLSNQERHRNNGFKLYKLVC